MSAAPNGATEAAVDLDLDVLEREDTHEPFTFAIEGHRFHLGHPEELDWHTQAELDSMDLSRIFRALLGPDQFEEFDRYVLPSWKLEKLMAAWGEHFGIELPESGASSTSSAATARPSRPTSRTTTKSRSRASRRAG